MDTKKLFTLRKDGIDYTLLRPGFPVNIFVDHFLVARGSPLFLAERIFPNNQVELFFNLGATNRGNTPQQKNSFDFSTTILSGLRTSPFEIRPGQHFYIAGMRFTLFGFYHLFGMPASEIVNQNFAAPEVLGKEIHQLREQLGEKDEENQILTLMYQWIYQKIYPKVEVARIWLKVDYLLQNHQVQVKKSLPALMGYSYKHTVHLMRRMTGLPPKLIHRIYRLHAIFTYPESFQQKDWQEVAYGCGYTDQSHFINEFRHFTGLTPSLFIQQCPKDYALKQLR